MPVWVSLDDYGAAKKSPDEAAELRRIRAAASRKGLVAGNVNVYLLDPDGEPIDSMGVSQAMEPQNLLPLLQRVVRDKNLRPRDARLVKASAGSPPAPAPQTPGGLLLHVWTRYLPPAEVEKGTTDDWVELTAEECAALLPEGRAAVGSSREVPAPVAEKIARFFYPAVVSYDARESKVRRAAFTATVAAASPRETQLSLRGTVELDHSRDGTIDGRVTAALVGWLRFDPQKRAVTSLQMVSQKADYVWHWEGRPSPSRLAIVVESTPPK